jgi:hypothetical protein
VSAGLAVPRPILRRLRTACAHLPEAYEEPAYAGTRWRIRGNTLAHVRTTDQGEGPITYVTFHCVGEEREALLSAGDPFHPGWGDGLIAMVLRDDGSTDWQEVKELLTESYCLLAPKKLIALLDPMRAGT